MKKAKSVASRLALTVAWVYAILASVATVVSGFEIAPYTGDGLRWAMGFAFSLNQAGGNMIPNFGWQQATEAWAATKIGDKK